MNIDERKQLIDKMFDEVEKENASKPVRSRVELKRVEEDRTPTDNEGKSSVHDILNIMVEDYNKKLNINLSTGYSGPVSLASIIDTQEALPFMAHCLSSAEHMTKHMVQFGDMSGIDCSDFREQVFMPIFMVCAGIAVRIHDLTDNVPEVDLSDFDSTRISLAADMMRDVKATECLSENNRVNWIKILCFDACTLALNISSAIISEQSSDPIAKILLSVVSVPILFDISTTLAVNMVNTSRELDKL